MLSIYTFEVSELLEQNHYYQIQSNEQITSSSDYFNEYLSMQKKPYQLPKILAQLPKNPKPTKQKS